MGQFVEMTEANGVVYVSGPYHLMADKVNPKLKSQGFRWNGMDRRWEIQASKLTPIKRKNLMAVIGPLTQAGAAGAGTDLRSPKEKVVDELNRRFREGLCIDPPYELRDKAKSLGGIWDDRYRHWCLPDAKALQELKDAINQTPKMVALREIARRKADKLGVSIPFEYKDEAKSLGGLWDPDTRMWYLSDQATKRKLLDKIESDQEAVRESARQVARRKLEQDEAERKRQGLKTYHFPGEYRGDHPAVGSTFKDRKTGEFMEVVSVKSTYYEEDGLSFGLSDDQGWMHYVTAKPSQDDAAIQGIKTREQEAQTRAEAHKRRRELVRDIQQRGDAPPGDTDLRRYDRLVLLGRNSVAYGGGDWFVVTPTHIWYVQNNGADGDDWGYNNVTTGGAGAIGKRVPHTEALEKELLALDALIGEK